MNSDKQQPLFRPDFLLIPFPLVEDRDLEPMDRMLYGLIYWYEHLRDGECRASNNSFAALLYTTTRAIQNSLTVLETKGYIERTYKDKCNRRDMIIYQRTRDKYVAKMIKLTAKYEQEADHLRSQMERYQSYMDRITS